MSSIMKLYKDSLPPSGIGNGGGVENEGGGVEETNAFFETDDKAYERAGGPGGYESGSGSLGSAATREVSVMSADGVFQGDLDVVRSGKYADDEGHREFLTRRLPGRLTRDKATKRRFHEGRGVGASSAREERRAARIERASDERCARTKKVL